MDEWGVGQYEVTAREIAPVSDVAVAALDLQPGARVLDVACGTGNAAVVAHAKGAQVTGLDASPRLIGVAQQRLPDGEFRVGDAAELPFEDGAFDAAVSVFGVIFASPAERAASEIARVVRSGGTVAITSWFPRGPVFEAVVVMRKALASVRPPPPEDAPRPTDWGDPAVIEGFLGSLGSVEITEHQLAIEATPDEVMERWEGSHPMWFLAREELEPAGLWEQARADMLAALRGAGMGPDSTSPYLLTVLRKA